MKVRYDRETDTLTITFSEGRILESDELRPGMIADFSEDGAVLRIELLDASRVVADPEAIDYRAMEPA